MSFEAERAAAVRAENDAMQEDRVITITLLHSEWLTAIDALHDRAEQTRELAGEVGEDGFDEPQLADAAFEYERVAQEIEGCLL